MSYDLHIPLSHEEHHRLLMFLDTPKFTGEPDYTLLRLIDLGFVSERADGMFLSGLGRARLHLGGIFTPIDRCARVAWPCDPTLIAKTQQAIHTDRYDSMLALASEE